MLKSAIICAALVISSMAQQPRMPDIEAQRAAMKKLSFLVGKWSGEARIFYGQGDPIELVQTEEAQYKLDGLVLVIEGVGKKKSDGQPVLQAFGIISYDEAAGTYHMRAYNDGRFLETDVKLAEDSKGTTWGFAFGEIKSSSRLRIDEKGDWTELTELVIGSQPAKKYMELRVSPAKAIGK